jgi:hypothetical protein
MTSHETFSETTQFHSLAVAFHSDTIMKVKGFKRCSVMRWKERKYSCSDYEHVKASLSRPRWIPVIFEVLSDVYMKIIVFWALTPCSLVNRFLRNIGAFPPVYRGSRPRRHQYSQISPDCTVIPIFFKVLNVILATSRSSKWYFLFRISG